jgi:beta-glucosidase
MKKSKTATAGKTASIKSRLFSPIQFPAGFLWGSASSAFQIEGGCLTHDFYDWALKGRIKDGTNPKDAVHFWKYYKSDIALMKKMNHSAARIGIEWARIEPEEGHFDEEAIAVYRDILKTMRGAKIAPMVTIHHFSNPMWLVKKGGWRNRDVVNSFARFVEKIVPALGDLVDIWITVNEPNIYASHAYFIGSFPPGEKNFLAMLKVQRNMALAHVKAYHLIHSIHRENGFGRAKVGAAHHLRTFDPARPSNLLDRFSTYLYKRIFNNGFLSIINRNGVTLDLFAFNYYSGDMISFPLILKGRSELAKNKLGWDIYPEGLYRVIMEYWNKYRLPVYITENGTCDDNDELRPEYILDHLYQVNRAVEQGADVAGFYHWSTMDNFELVDGLMSRFGLIHVDHNSPKRTRKIKKSGELYAEISKENAITPEITKKFLPHWKPL